EKNNFGFDIERSTDNGSTWKWLAYVPSQSPNGFSNQQLDYVQYDNNPFKGINKYRLRQLSKDGTSMLSEERTLDFTEDNTLKVYPVPADKVLYINGTNSGYKMLIFDALGRLMISAEGKERRTSIDVSALGSGFYQLH